MPPVQVKWYGGINNLPPLPEEYGSSSLDPNIPPPNTGALKPVKLNTGKIIYSRDITFNGSSHEHTLSIIPETKAKEMASRPPVVPTSPSNHWKKFLLACKEEEQTRSPFSIAGPLSQVFCLVVLAQWLDTNLAFDRDKKSSPIIKWPTICWLGHHPVKVGNNIIRFNDNGYKKMAGPFGLICILDILY